MKKYLLIGKLIILFIFLLIWYVISKGINRTNEISQYNKLNISQQSQSHGSIKKEDETMLSDTSVWETIPDPQDKDQIIYSSKKFGFQLSLPKKWKLISSKNDSLTNMHIYLHSDEYINKTSLTDGGWVEPRFEKGMELYIDVNSNNTFNSLEGYKSFMKKTDMETKESLPGKLLLEEDGEIQGEKTYITVRDNLELKTVYKRTIFINRGNIYSIGGQFRKNDRASELRYDQIIKTFRFIDN